MMTGPPSQATQNANNGIRFDFNDGLRVQFPRGNWRIEISNSSTGESVHSNAFCVDEGGKWLISPWRFFFPYEVLVTDANTSEIVLHHRLNLRNQRVFIVFSNPLGLGDQIAWMPIVSEFQKAHDCQVACFLPDNKLFDIFARSYPNLAFELLNAPAIDNAYATYRLGLFDESQNNFHPRDYRKIGLQEIAKDILGIQYAGDIHPRLIVDQLERPLGKYVCIGVQSTGAVKLWHNENGWNSVVDYLISKGYRVLCVDQFNEVRYGDYLVRRPKSAEDFTGDFPISSRARLIRGAACFIGLGSGLSWLAWGCGTPVVLISGFSNPLSEFNTPGRIHSNSECRDCWNEYGASLAKVGNSCPRGADFICSKSITAADVVTKLEAILPE